MFMSRKRSRAISQSWRGKITVVQPSAHFWMAIHLGKDLLHGWTVSTGHSMPVQGPCSHQVKPHKLFSIVWSKQVEKVFSFWRSRTENGQILINRVIGVSSSTLCGQVLLTKTATITCAQMKCQCFKLKFASKIFLTKKNKY